MGMTPLTALLQLELFWVYKCIAKENDSFAGHQRY